MSGLNIFVVEVHDVMRDAMVMALRSMGHTVASAKVYDDKLHAVDPDILLLSLNGEDSLGQVRRLRAAQPDIGIILIALGSQGDELAIAYQSGADLVLPKPTSIHEVSAAIRSLERRMQPLDAGPVQLVLDLATLQLQGPQASVDVSETECLLLGAFANSVEQRLTKERLFKITGRNGADFSKAALEVQMVRLRRKLEQAGAAEPTIKAIRGEGYQLCAPVVVKRTFKSPHHVSPLSS